MSLCSYLHKRVSDTEVSSVRGSFRLKSVLEPYSLHLGPWGLPGFPYEALHGVPHGAARPGNLRVNPAG